ncbi:MAG: chemoreceptor glutamine deamidase CheD [Gammaproteobacteria bacterium]
MPPRPCALPGFADISRHFDSLHNAYVARIDVGECYVSRSNEIISTVLGSCISACIHDPVAGLGGMNHFMLPGCGRKHSQPGEILDKRFGVASMEVLINALLRAGASKHRMEVKLFGGAVMLTSASLGIGDANTRFAREFLRLEDMRLVASDCGGPHARRILYWPASGRARIMHLNNEDVAPQLAAEQRIATRPADLAGNGDVELF